MHLPELISYTASASRVSGHAPDHITNLIRPYRMYGTPRAHELLRMELGTPTDLLQVIFKVWLEMLCYAANHCSRDSHAKHLSRAPDGRRAVWAFLWRCPAPPKVRVFGWRVVTNSLATWANKFDRHMETSDVCPLCGLEREDTFHVFCRCPSAVEL